MKKILITGANSYIGTSLEKYLNSWDNKYYIETLDMKDPLWVQKDFSEFDTVFHVAGIAHSDSKKINEEKKKLYYKINTELTISTAIKAKNDGVNQFIFMSSSIVYGDSSPIGKRKIITKETVPNPSNFYGDSKLQAEIGILPLQNDRFNVVILRPPMIYGKGCKGNYQTLRKFALKFPIFPKIKNERSMLYIDNLCEFVRLIIENNDKGIFWPCNNGVISTSNLVNLIAKNNGKKILFIPFCTWIIKILSFFTRIINKAFGNFVYSKDLSYYPQDYNMYSFEESIKETET